MVVDLLIICTTLVILPLAHAKAEEIRERARKMEIENDRAELE